MFEKIMHESGNMLQNGAQMGAKIRKILIKMEVQKYMDFWFTRRAVDGRPGIGGRDFGGSLLVRFNILGIYTGCLTYWVFNILGVNIGYTYTGCISQVFNILGIYIYILA